MPRTPRPAVRTWSPPSGGRLLVRGQTFSRWQAVGYQVRFQTCQGTSAQSSESQEESTGQGSGRRRDISGEGASYDCALLGPHPEPRTRTASVSSWYHSAPRSHQGLTQRPPSQRASSCRLSEISAPPPPLTASIPFFSPPPAPALGL